MSGVAHGTRELSAYVISARVNAKARHFGDQWAKEKYSSTDLNSENNKFDMETFDLVSEYCTAFSHARFSLYYVISSQRVLAVGRIGAQTYRYVPLFD